MANESTVVRIADRGEILTLHYSGARAAHQGDSWWGVAVGFRAMQAAAELLSKGALWDRDKLFVVSGHPGPGVRDAIEYVTGCVSAGRFLLMDCCRGETVCSRDMRFEWQVHHTTTTGTIRLREGFVTEEFYSAVDSHLAGNTPESFPRLKRELANRAWQEPLSELFDARQQDSKQSGFASCMNSA